MFADFADATALTGRELVPLLQSERASVVDAQWVGNLGSNTVTGLVAGTSAASANTTLLQSYLNTAETAGGGRVRVPIGTWYINDTLLLGSRVVLCGDPGWGAKLVLADGASTDASHKAMISARGNTNYVGVEDLYLDGNKAGQTGDTTYGAAGIDFYSRGTTEGSGPPVYDGGLWCRNVMVYGCKGEAFYVRGAATTMRVHGCFAYHNDGVAFWLKTDCIISDCVAANNGGYGYFFQNGTSAIGHGLKSFGSCQRYQGPDFLVSYCNTVMLTGCQAEDSSQAGFWLTASSHVTMADCQVYRMSTIATQDANRSAFWVEDDGAGGLCHDVKIRGSVLGGGAAGVNYALTTRNLGSDVDIELNTETIAISRWRHLSGTRDARVVFDNCRLEAVQNPTFAASYTPDPYLGGTVVLTLTGNITINAPAEPYVGQELRFVLTQDGTGTRTTTFNAIFKTVWTPNTTAAKVNTISFVYNGSAWVQTASVVGL